MRWVRPWEKGALRASGLLGKPARSGTASAKGLLELRGELTLTRIEVIDTDNPALLLGTFPP
jgi:hypothetical protein